MNGLRKSLLPLFLLSSAVFLGGILFLTKNHSPYKLLYNESSFQKNIENEKNDRSVNGLKWRENFVKRGQITVVSDIKNNLYLTKIGLKKGDEIIRLNSFYKPSLERTVKFLQENRNKAVSLIVKRGEKLYKVRALPPFYY